MASKAPRSSGAEAGGARLAAALDRFAAECLPAILPRERWFGSKGRRIVSVAVFDAAPLGARAPGAWLVLLEVAFAEGPSERYSVPLRVGDAGHAPAEALGMLDAGGGPAPVLDALDAPDVRQALLDAFDGGLTLRSRRGTLRFVRGPALPRFAPGPAPVSRRLRGEQSHTSVVYGDRLILKVLRRIDFGINPEREMTDFLTARVRFPNVPQLAGAAEYADADGRTATLALLHLFTPNQDDGWSWVLGHLARLRDIVAARARHEPLGAAGLDHLVRDAAAAVLPALRRLGTLTGGLHAALASDPTDPAFAPEPVTAADTARWRARIEGDLERTLATLRSRLEGLDAPVRTRARALLGGAAPLGRCLAGLGALSAEGCHAIRVHGDYHLGQTLRTEDDFVILDFEGEPARSLAERRAKDCALRDVAGMLRSFDYAAATVFGADEPLAAARETWRRVASGAFLDGYVGEATRAPARLVPTSPPALARALAAFELDKALYEVRYEIDNRPAWLGVPLAGLAALVGGDHGRVPRAGQRGGLDP